MDIEKILLNHYEKYPKMEVQDFFKLIHQNTFGCEHLIKNVENSFGYLEKEWFECSKSYDENIYEEIGNGYCRFNLYNGKINNFDVTTIHKIFVASANLPIKKSNNTIEYNLSALSKLIESSKINLNYNDYKNMYTSFVNSNYSPVHHSKAYHTFYFPAYRVLNNQYIKYLDIIKSIDKKLEENEEVVIGIDGKCGSGKTLLGDFLGLVYDCNVIKMDDFFLPINLREKVLYDENIHKERFYNEVFTKLKTKKDFSYGVFDCASQKIVKNIDVKHKKLTVIEGSYSICDKFRNIYDMKIFVDIEEHKQLKRILNRNGKKIADIFSEKWIPQENNYFNKYDIKNKADFVLE